MRKTRSSRFLTLTTELGNLNNLQNLYNDIVVLARDISIEEIEGAIKALNNDKAPGPNGFPIEFYKSNISGICKDLHDLYSKALSIGSLG